MCRSSARGSAASCCYRRARARAGTRSGDDGAGNEMPGSVRPGRIRAMDGSAEGQLRVIRKVIAVTQAADIPVWLFGGWGLDARIGRITREHGDVEFWVERIHAERSEAVLVDAGATALTPRPREKAWVSRGDDFPLATPSLDGREEGSS